MISTALRYFLEAVDSGTIAEAAQRLHVAPSAVSRMIRKLEEEHGVTLIERRPRGIVPSEAGTLLAEYGRRVILDSERTRADILELSTAGQRTIRVATNQAFGTELMPNIIARMQSHDPSLVFHLSIFQSEIINERVREGKEDIGITHDMSRPKGVDILYQSSAPLYAVMSATHELAHEKEVTFQAVQKFPVALMSKGSTNRLTVDMCALAEGVTLEPSLTTNNVSAIQNYCRMHGAISFFSRVTVSSSIARGELRAVRLASKHPGKRFFHIQAMTGRELPKSVLRLVETLRTELTDI